MKLYDKTIVITGASKGLGKKMAMLLCKKYSNLILISRTKELLIELKNKIHNLTGNTPLIIQCDITNEHDINNMVKIIQEKYKKIDVLINNAGIGIYKKISNITNEEMRKQFEVNFYGAFNCTKVLLPLIKKSKSGYILNIGSLYNKISFAETSVYSATKCALYGFTEGLRHEIKNDNIKIGYIMPGSMNTSFHKDEKENTLKAPAFLTLDPEKVAKKIDNIILKRKKKIVMYKWILFLMRLKKLFT